MVTLERSRMQWSGVVLSVVMMTGAMGVALGSLTTDKTAARVERPDTIVARGGPTVASRLAVVDSALARKDMSAAVYAWSDAHAFALGTRRWDTMVDVGDAAARIDALGDTPPRYLIGFRAQARQAYLRALLLARQARSSEGVERVAQAFAALGDAEMAARVRRITLTP
jgi:hypothetical protein